MKILTDVELAGRAQALADSYAGRLIREMTLTAATVESRTTEEMPQTSNMVNLVYESPTAGESPAQDDARTRRIVLVVNISQRSVSYERRAPRKATLIH